MSDPTPMPAPGDAPQRGKLGICPACFEDKPCACDGDCAICQEPKHAEPAKDPRGIECPGEEADEKLIEAYHFNVQLWEAKQKIENTDWVDFGDKAKEAYKSRKRADIDIETLKDHANAITGVVSPVIKARVEDAERLAEAGVAHPDEQEGFQPEHPTLVLPGPQAGSGKLITGKAAMSNEDLAEVRAAGKSLPKDKAGPGDYALYLGEEGVGK
jgi:hypothetical protein